MTDVDTKLKKFKKREGTKRWNVKILEMETNCVNFQEMISEKMDSVRDLGDINDAWEKIKKSIHDTAEEICGREGMQPKKQEGLTNPKGRHSNGLKICFYANLYTNDWN